MAKDLRIWDPEDEAQWNAEGKKIANRNLWISIPALLCGFAVWLYWGIITIQMSNLGFPFTGPQLFTLAAVAGLTGATLRIPSTFFIRMCGGRNTIALTTALLIIPAVGAGLLLQDQTTPLWKFQALALLSGFGGGNFSSSMSNISFFYPKKVQGYSLGMNAGLGNFGVTTMQIVIPLVMTMAIFGGAPMVLATDSGTLIGKIAAGTDTYLHNAGFIWAAILVPITLAAWFGMNNITADHVSPNIGSTIGAFAKILGMLLIGLVVATFGLWLMLPATSCVGSVPAGVVEGGACYLKGDPSGSLNGVTLTNGIGSSINLSKWIVLPIVIILTVGILRMLPGAIGKSLKHQYKIFGNKHTWAMTVIYTMTFGSFIGFAVAFGLSIKFVFGFQHIIVDGVMTHGTENKLGPSALMFAWTGPFIGALIRPVGGMIADKMGGAKVTQIISIIMVASALGVAHYMKLAYVSETPQDYFIPFLILFLILFAATGIGNGSTFRTIAQVFNKEQAGPVLGWTAAVAAYGAFIIPRVFGEQIKATTPENALYGFAAFYVVCIIINWWFYLRPNAYVKNP